MKLRELLATTDVGMRHFKVIGIYSCSQPTIENILTKQEIYSEFLQKEVLEWYTTELPPKSGKERLVVYFEK